MREIDKEFKEEAKELTGPGQTLPDMSHPRLLGLYDDMQRTRLGRNLSDILESTYLGHKVVLRFDPSIYQAHGIKCAYWENSHLFLNPWADDALLSPVLLHEMCHAAQPLQPVNRRLYGQLEARLFYSRLIEGDAYAHQTAQGLEFILEAEDDTRHMANLGLFKKMSPQGLRRLEAACEDYLQAKNAKEKEACMAAFFWMFQEDMLHIYDGSNLDEFRKQAALCIIKLDYQLTLGPGCIDTDILEDSAEFKNRLYLSMIDELQTSVPLLADDEMRSRCKRAHATLASLREMEVKARVAGLEDGEARKRSADIRHLNEGFENVLDRARKEHYLGTDTQGIVDRIWGVVGAGIREDIRKQNEAFRYMAETAPLVVNDPNGWLKTPPAWLKTPLSRKLSP